MPRWIGLRTPEDGWIRTGKAPFDAEMTDALVQAARSVRARAPRAWIVPRSYIYVVLLEYKDASNGLYVGMTGLGPDERYLKHKAGYKSSRWVRRYGIGLMPALYRHLNPLDGEAAVLAEVELAVALRSTGLRVHQA